MRNSPNFSESIGGNEIPNTVLDYLVSKNVTILNDYRTADGQYSEHCSAIAFNIAKLLIASGKKPYIAELSADFRKGNLPLAPKIYEGRVKWGGHQVCCCDGQVFDPILSEPIAIESYAKNVFGEDIKMEILFSYEQIENHINR